MNALVRDVCGAATAPREWRRLLGKQRRALRAAIVRSSLNGVGTRLGGALVGEELIGTLSDRLARSLRGLDAAPSGGALDPSRERRVESADELPTTRRVTPAERPVASAGEATLASMMQVAERRAWVGDTARDEQRRAGEVMSVASNEPRELIDAVVYERGTEIVRAVGLESPVTRVQRDVVRTSPLDVALRRYWQAAARAPSEPRTQKSGSTPPLPSEHFAPTPSATDTRRPAIGTDMVPVPTHASLVSPDRTAPPEPRGWWSTRVDAIHTRTESFVPAPARPSAARFDDDIVDESAFADALAEVLHRQARAYGVVVP